MKSTLTEVTRVLVIGWAGADNHFFELLHETSFDSKQTLIVSGSGEAADANAERVRAERL